MPCLINSQISWVETFLYSDKKGKPEEGRRIQQLKRSASKYHNKDENNSVKIQHNK